MNTLNYTCDDAGRITARNADAFGYNARSEVVSATVASNEYAYAYDYIGNHTTASVNSDTTTYAANNLNQYTSFSNLVQSCNPVYDLDGNMLTNGVWSYTWDCENRLVTVSSNNVCVVSNAYDYLSRRVLKATPEAVHAFVYDGWNLIHETVTAGNGDVSEFQYFWGPDLSGTLQGAGGVGGLLAVSINGQFYLPCVDNNGNITAYVGESGSIVAEYVYDAYGGAIATSGSISDTFRHRFSTKYYDVETGLYYYGYRFYDPVMHRWLNRDPIGERGGLNLYVNNGNDSINQIDYVGLFGCSRRPEPTSKMLIRENISVSVHGSRYGGDGAFDGRAKRSGKDKWFVVETGKELFDLLEQKSKSGESCCHCIETLVIHSHATGAGISMRWDSGFGIDKPISISPMGFGESEATRGRAGEARDVNDLRNAIAAKKVCFCSPCTIKLFGCWTGDQGNLAQALSEVTPCQVIAPIGKCYPVDSDGNRVVEGSGSEEVAGGSSGWNSWSGGIGTPFPGPVPY